MNDDALFRRITAQTGRDAGKTFQVNEVPPQAMAVFVLRLLAAVRMAGIDDLIALASGANSADGLADVSGLFRVLAGCDAKAVGELIHDALNYVEVAPDPKHPGMFRALIDNDIRERATLGEILGEFLKLNILPPGAG